MSTTTSQPLPITGTVLVCLITQGSVSPATEDVAAPAQRSLFHYQDSNLETIPFVPAHHTGR